MKEYRLRVANMDCENDAARLRRSLESQVDMELLQILASSGTVCLTVNDTVLSQEEVEAKLSQFGFQCRSRVSKLACRRSGRIPRCSPQLFPVCCCWSDGF